MSGAWQPPSLVAPVIHVLSLPDEDLRLVCMFTPALTGDEAHRLTESGIHPSIY